MTEPIPRDGGPSAVSLKALGVGLLLSFFLGVLAVHSMSIHASYLAMDVSAPGALMLLFLLVAIVNPLLRFTRARLIPRVLVSLALAAWIALEVSGPPPQTSAAFVGRVLLATAGTWWALHLAAVARGGTMGLSGAQLLVVYAMLLCACAVCTMGFTTVVIPSLAGVFYYARPGNRWDTIFHPHLPRWLVPNDPNAIRRFFEGAGADPIDWGVWLSPLMCWLVFVMALATVMISLMVILRKQWVERERLVYPIVQLPQEMIRDRVGSGEVPFFRNPLVWIGFAVPFIATALNGIHAYWPSVPGLRLHTGTRLFADTVTLRFRFSFVMVGFAYLIRKDAAFSIWFFALLALFQRGLFKFMGIASTEKLLYGTNRSAMQSHLGMGAIIVLVAYGLWVARHHLRDVFAGAFMRSANVDDSDEIMSYRSAVLSLAGGLLVMIVWLCLSGVPLWAALLLIGAGLILFLGVTRIVVEVGLSNTVAPMSPPCVVTSTVGATAFSSGQLACLTPTFLWTGWMRTHVMASAAHGLKLLSGVPGVKRRAFWALLLAVLAAALGSMWMLLRNCYAYGGINFGYPYLTSFAKTPWNYMGTLIRNPPGPHWGGILSTGIGAAIMGLLIFLRNTFTWWPLAPIGFPLAGVWLMERLWFSIFVSWLIKTVLLKYGGPRAYHKFRPMFLGFILGQFVAAGFWLGIDSMTGMVGNRVFWI